MNRHVNAIAGRLSLRAPQRRSLEVLDRITEIAPPKKGADIAAALEATSRRHRAEYDLGWVGKAVWELISNLPLSIVV